MAPNPTVMQAIPQLDYRVTVGDVAAHTGLTLAEAQQGLLAIATDAGGHLQVAETGDIAYEFPKNFRNVLRNKYLRLRLQEWWQRISSVLFYLVRISFGIILIATIVLMLVALAIIVIAISRGGSDDDNGGPSEGGGGMPFFFFPRFFWFGPDPFWFFYYDDYSSGYRRRRASRRGSGREESGMNFLEAVFSFLFGDGNPNYDREDRRWQAIANTIRANGGAITAEQVAPYLDATDEDEDFMLPVLTRFHGRPEVSERGELVYFFPELQVTADERARSRSVPSYLNEKLYKFSEASSGQLTLAGGLGGVYVALALVLGVLLQDGTLAAELGGLVAFVASGYWLILAYGVAYLTVPLVRYFWIQRRNQKIQARNEARSQRARLVADPSPDLQQKLGYARQFAARTIVDRDDLAYSTERDLVEQELEQADKIDAEWRRRLESNSPNS